MKIVKEKIGMKDPRIVQIVTEPQSAHPTYGAAISAGAAVKASLSVQTNDLSIPGDNVELVKDSSFRSGSLATETTYDDLDLYCAVYGAKRTADGVTDSDSDSSPVIGYGYKEDIIREDKSRIWRGVFFWHVSASLSGLTDNADTRKESVEAKPFGTTFDVTRDNSGAWRSRDDFETEAEAELYLQRLYGNADVSIIRVEFKGSGAGGKLPISYAVENGESKTIDFGAVAPSALYDNGTDVTSQITSKKYTLSNVSADHELLAIYTPAT